MSGSGGFLSGRLGLSGARIPHADRHDLLWLSRGRLSVEDGTRDIADLYRAELTIPLAFQAARKVLDNPTLNFERILRRDAASEFRKRRLVPKMIDRVKDLLDDDDDGSDP